MSIGDGEPCGRCVRLSMAGKLRAETVLPLLEGSHAPLACVPPDHQDHGPCCVDCAAADTLVKLGMMGSPDRGRDTLFLMARIAVGNDRQEQLRLPGAPMGLVAQGLVRPCSPGDMERHHEWMARVGLLLHTEESS